MEIEVGVFRDLHNSSTPNSIIVLLFIQNNSLFLKHAHLHRRYIHLRQTHSARLGLYSSANILQIADVAVRVVFLLFLPCF